MYYDSDNRGEPITGPDTEPKASDSRVTGNKKRQPVLNGNLKSGIDWDKVKVYKPGEEPSPFGVKVDYDPEVEKMNKAFEADLEKKIEKQPEEVLADATMPEEAKDEAAQVLDGDSRTNEANNDKVETAVEKLSEDFDTVDDLATYLDTLDEEGNPFFPEDEENPDAVWNQYENPAEAYRNYVNPEDTEKWNAYQESKAEETSDSEMEELQRGFEDLIREGKERQAEEAREQTDAEVQANADLEMAKADPVAAAQRVLSMPALNENPNVSSNGTSGSFSGGSSESLPVDVNKAPIGGSFSHALANLGTGSGQSSASSVGSTTSVDNKVESTTSHAGGGEITNMADNTTSVKGSQANGFTTSNGSSYNSGGVKHTGSSLKVQKTKLPSGESKEQADQTVNLEDATVSSIETRIREIKPETLAEQLGFKVGANVSYNGTAISNCTPAQLDEIEKILETLGI